LVIHLALSIVCHDKGDQQIQKIFIPTMQQCFHPSANICFTGSLRMGGRTIFKVEGTSARQKN